MAPHVSPRPGASRGETALAGLAGGRPCGSEKARTRIKPRLAIFSWPWKSRPENGLVLPRAKIRVAQGTGLRNSLGRKKMHAVLFYLHKSNNCVKKPHKAKGDGSPELAPTAKEKTP